MLQYYKKFVVANFWWRFLANFFDTALTIAFLVVIIQISDIKNFQKGLNDYYTFFIFAILYTVFYYFLFPLLNNGVTLFMMLFGLYCQNLEKNSKIKLGQIWKRYLFGSGFFLFLMLVQVIIVPPRLVILFTNNEKLSISQEIIITIPGALATIWVVLSLINHISSLISKRKMSLSDHFAKTVLVRKSKQLMIATTDYDYLKNLEIRKYLPIIWKGINEWEYSK